MPPAAPGTVVYTGSTLNPVSTETEGYPALDLLDQERLIITFPMDSGLPPILVLFKSPRYEAGTSTGNGAQVTDTWRKSAASLEGAPIPAQIADLLRDREYRSFNAFRRQFWKAVANDPELSKQFSPQDIRRMRKHGYSPWVDRDDKYMSKRSHEIHHVVPISEQGGVYDMDN
ncbi:S-type pyocin domain-containing protein [Pseudomonas putida]|uniref:S-type pyocin domain-containing protein n=1 Tax=Pseudomonas putida TaxID=303 RepID=UPI001E4367A3|nr:S-type pyocin domain-containing protein [Pseudomonas putida]